MTAVKHILLVDDDVDLRTNLAELLSSEDDFTTTEVGTGKDAFEIIKSNEFDLIILDVGLPDIDGREACKKLRQAGVMIPIIMLTGVTSDDDTVQGLEAGANDYVPKPFRYSVLLARVRAHLRQHELSEDATFVIGPYSFKPSTKTLTDKTTNSRIRLTEKETAILKYLKRASGQAVARETLLDEVWGYNAGVTTHTLETHIYRLRQKIEKNPAEAQILLTEAGGYRLA